MLTIFVSIASYRDPDLLNTINNCINTAKYPERLTIGVCLQDTTEKMKEVNNDFKEIVLTYNKTHKIKINKIKVYNLFYKDANGAGYARSIIQDKLYNNENFYIQIDSHSRFNNIWDILAIEQFKLAVKLNLKIINGEQHNSSPDYKLLSNKKKYFSKVVLSTYPNDCKHDEYINNQFNSAPVPVSFLNNTIRPSGNPFTKSKYPIRGYWICGGFIFASREWVKEIKIERNIPFNGEEDAITIKSFMKGWNIYVPYCCICYHNYTNNLLESNEKTRPLVWEDTSIDGSKVSDILDKLYNITNNKNYIRSSIDYQIYMGINYENRKIMKSQNEYIKERENERNKYIF